jgi:CTP:molybdopterin cytidylyltransferase MocA
VTRTVAGIVLAGGASRRMGTAKAALVLDGRSFLECVLAALREAGLDDVLVVSGSAHDAVLRALPPRDHARVLRNPDPGRGQLSSLKVALGVVRSREPRPDGVVVALVDHPAVQAATIARLVAAWADATHATIVVPTFAGRRGHPVLFAADVWDELLATPDEIGARAVVHADASRVLEVAVDDPGVHVDVDTPEDFQRLTSVDA